MVWISKNAFVILVLMILCSFLPVSAADWKSGFTVSIGYEELYDKNPGKAQVSLMMVLPMGTPLHAKEEAIASALAALKDIWNIASVHEEVLGFIGPQIPLDVQKAISVIDGSNFVMAIIEAFNSVENTGFSRFQSDTQVTSVEIVKSPPKKVGMEYPDAPRSFHWVVGGEIGVKSRHENWVLAALINYSASILSFRSEFRRFPSSIAELKEMGHVFIEPLNPYNGEPVRIVTEPSPGDISFQYVNLNKVILQTYTQNRGKIEVVRREINLYSADSFDLLYQKTASLTPGEKKVARYVFQISQILNEYYSQHGDLPYSVPQCETEGFAYVSFTNPFTNRDAQQADILADLFPGDYTYHRISSSTYFLVGYGEKSQPIITISKNFGQSPQKMMPSPARR